MNQQQAVWLWNDATRDRVGVDQDGNEVSNPTTIGAVAMGAGAPTYVAMGPSYETERQQVAIFLHMLADSISGVLPHGD